MKHFLTTTAVVMSLSGAAYAESHSATTDESTTMTETSESTTMTESSENTTMTDPNAVVGIGVVTAMPEDFFASNLIGMRIYNVEADMDTTMPVADGSETEWDDIGEINDLIVTADGNVSAVILGVGGFLGIGERDVSVSMDAITVVSEDGDGDDRFLVVKTSKEELENAPVFEREDM